MGENKRLRRLVQLLDLQISALNVQMGCLRQRVMDSHEVGHRLMGDVRNLLHIGNPDCQEIYGEREDPEIYEEAEGGVAGTHVEPLVLCAGRTRSRGGGANPGMRVEGLEGDGGTESMEGLRGDEPVFVNECFDLREF